MSKYLTIKKINTLEKVILVIFITAAGLILPVILILIVKYAGYSEVIEEIAKGVVVLFLILRFPKFKTQLLSGVWFGFLFGLSESFLYLNQIFQGGDLHIFWERFLWTLPMHIVTVLIMAVAGSGKKWFIFIGLLGAIIIHLLFNTILVPILV